MSTELIERKDCPPVGVQANPQDEPAQIIAAAADRVEGAMDMARALPLEAVAPFTPAATCSGSPTETFRLANRSPFGLTFADNEGALWLALSDNGLTIADWGSPTAFSAHALCKRGLCYAARPTGTNR